MTSTQAWEPSHSLSLKETKHVVGIEATPEAITAAAENAKKQLVQHGALLAGDMKKVFTDDFIATHGTPDVVITDPPREGHAQRCRTAIACRSHPQRIVYVEL